MDTSIKSAVLGCLLISEPTPDIPQETLALPQDTWVNNPLGQTIENMSQAHHQQNWIFSSNGTGEGRQLRLGEDLEYVLYLIRTLLVPSVCSFGIIGKFVRLYKIKN